MARPKKRGLEYFPFDVDLFQDIKIRKLIKFQGGKAVTVYALLLCLIYKNGYYIKWDEDLPFIISEQTGFEERYIVDVINSCLKLGLFNSQILDKHKVFTSRGIQERYCDIFSKMKRRVIIKEFNCINSEETQVNSEETQVNSEETQVNSEFSTQKKIKENKRNNISTTSTHTHARTHEGEIEKDIPENSPFIGELKKNLTWQEAVCMNFHIKPPDIIEYIDKFSLDLKCRGTIHESLRDAMRHFNDWLRIQLKAKEDDRIKKQSNDKRRGVKETATKQKDYHSSF